MKNLLEIKNLIVEIGGEDILNDFNLDIAKGEVQALLGPNACGKSTLANVIVGNNKIKKGDIKFMGKKINNLSPEKRVKIGISMAYQNPPQIKGIRLGDLLKEISSKKIEEDKLIKKELNVGMSGGEKKISELRQIVALEPKLVILDEIDSGLDIKKIKEVAEVIKKKFIKKGVSLLIITHNGEILDLLKPSWVNVMIGGKIIGRSKDYKKVLNTIRKYDYEKCKKCKGCIA